MEKHLCGVTTNCTTPLTSYVLSANDPKANAAVWNVRLSGSSTSLQCEITFDPEDGEKKVTWCLTEGVGIRMKELLKDAHDAKIYKLWQDHHAFMST